MFLMTTISDDNVEDIGNVTDKYIYYMQEPWGASGPVRIKIEKDTKRGGFSQIAMSI